MWRVCLGLVVIVLTCGSSAQADPAVDVFFNSTDPFIRKTVLPNIEKNRKSEVTLRFVDDAGKPLAHLKLTGKLIRHSFLFGCCVPDLPDPTGKYTAAWAEVFNFAIPANAGKWVALEKVQGKTDFSHLDELFDLCRKHNMTTEFHFLSGYHPTWLAALPVAEKAKAQKAHALETVEHCKDRFDFIQVYNEDWLTHIKAAKVYFDQTAFFQELTSKYPTVKFGVSDCWTLDATGPLPDPAVVKARYPGISFLAMHAHRPRGQWITPKEMYANFDKYTDSGIKLHLSEFGTNLGKILGKHRQGEWTDAVRAEYFVQVFATAFSHPAVAACNLWGMSPNQKSMPGNALVDEQYNPNAVQRALKSLLHEKLVTVIDGQTDTAGELRLRGFQGTYTLTAELPEGKEAAASFVLSPDQQEILFQVADGKITLVKK